MPIHAHAHDLLYARSAPPCAYIAGSTKYIFLPIFFDLPIDKLIFDAIMKVQKDKNKQKMLALNILTNKLKEVKDEVQVAPKGGQCYTAERTA